MVLPKAFVTLLTGQAYLPGALVLLHALHELHPKPRDFQIVCLVTPETVDARTIGALRDAGYDLVIGVEPIASGPAGQAGLDLMGRPDLDLALTKLHLFRLGSAFSTIVYLDADTLPLRRLDQLFALTEGHAFSASPDIGWPDCFNSGVMVIRPNDADFDGLRTMMTESAEHNGSFDGADQGLLNNYFSEDGPGGQWNRLPFTYNVTPSAAYQYAPAYKHYASTINVIHFIGANKPWSSLAWRPAGKGSVDKAASDYDSLVDRWYDVYDRNIRPTAIHEPKLAKRFTVPEHHAVWNEPEHERAQANQRLDLVELKEAVEKGLASFHPGQYTSLPLEGRVDLIAPRPPPRVATPPPPSVPASQGQPAQATPHNDAPPATSDTHHHAQDNHQHHDSHSHHSHDHHGHNHSNQPAPPNTTWDASRNAPPMQSMPEMAIPMTTVYTPAWDEPVKAQASYFKTPSQEQSHIHDYPSLPTNVQKSDWYKKFTATEPSRDKIQTVFPWESETRRPTPSRSFPKDEKPFVAPPPAPKVRTMKAPGPIKIPAAGPVPAVVQVKQPVPTRAPLPAKQTFEEAMASYRNAWDGVASINRYAKGLSSIGIGVDRRTAGLASAPHTPHHRATNPFDAPEEEEEEDPGNYANALYRNRHTQTESPKLTDAVVQASPELSPPRSPQDQDKRVKITFRTKRPAAARNFPTYSFATTYTASRPAGAVGRVWDPQTDIEVRRQAAQHVVDQFVNVKNGGSD